MIAFTTIKSNEEFQNIFQKGHSINGRFIVVYFLNNYLPGKRFGICVGRKLGTAVIRNRIKRLIREAIRFQSDSILPGYDILIVAKNPILSVSLQSIINEFKYILKKAGLDSVKKANNTEDSL